MSDNPLYPNNSTNDSAAADDNSYLLSSQQSSVRSAGISPNEANPAANLIREKLDRIYAEEPDAFEEEHEAEVIKPRSKHQQFMYELSTSGKSLAEIQTEWHNYYVALPDYEKHHVWQEFYEANEAAQHKRHPGSTVTSPSESASSKPAPFVKSYGQTKVPEPEPSAAQPPEPFKQPESLAIQVPAQLDTPGITVSAPVPALPADPRAPAQIRQYLRDKVSAGGKLKVKHHLQSLSFGLVIGGIVLVIFLFGFFNEVVIAPFIQPGRSAAATPIIVNPSSVTASSTPEIIIPKINLEIPVDFSQTSTNEATIENALEDGIVHYPSTVMPGQAGNSAFFGHSSNNIFNPGKYKFAFVLLHELVPGDTFYITYNGQVYIYKVFSRQIVDPSDVGVLGNVAGHTATATLITCDPPGTSLHRLVVVGDQISPDPTGDTTGNNTSIISTSSTQLPGNGPSLFSRLWHDIF